MANWLHLRCDCGETAWSVRPQALCRKCGKWSSRPKKNEVVTASDGYMVAGAGDRDTECALYRRCLSGASNSRGDEWHCPSDCQHRVLIQILR